MHFIRTLSVVCAVLSVIGPATSGALQAQQIPSPYRFLDTRQEAGPFAGHMRTGTGQSGLGPKSGAVYGARYGIDISGPFGLEGTVSYVGTTRDVVDPRRAGTDRVRGPADVSLVLIDARLRFSLTGQRTWHSLSPFLIGGGGIGFDAASRPALDQELRESDRYEFGVRATGILGGGVRWVITDRLLMRGDAHLTLWQIDPPTGFSDPTLNLESPGEKEWVNNRTLTLGLAYRF